MDGCSSDLNWRPADFVVQGVAMDFVSPIYRLDGKWDTRPLHGRDWDMNESEGMVLHRPGKLLFAILIDDEQSSTPVPITALAARLVHQCDGAASVGPDRMKRLAKDAIHMFYLFADICMPEPVRPDPCRQLGLDDDCPF